MSAPLETLPATGLKTSPGDDGGETVQVIYGHLPPAAVLAREQHLRNPTYLEQRAEQRWFGGNAGPDGWDGWRRTERQVVRRLCRALQRQNPSKLQTFQPG
jgi:hypothetical protein